MGVLLLLVATLAACSSDVAPDSPVTSASSSMPMPSVTETPSVTTTISQGEATAELQAYLDAWAATGPAAASQKYLVAGQQVASDTDAPHLTSGKVVKVAGAQPTPTGLHLLASLEMAFDGDPGGWGNGPNDRFVTFTPRGGDVPYEMSFATGP